MWAGGLELIDQRGHRLGNRSAASEFLHDPAVRSFEVEFHRKPPWTNKETQRTGLLNLPETEYHAVRAEYAAARGQLVPPSGSSSGRGGRTFPSIFISQAPNRK